MAQSRDTQLDTHELSLSLCMITQECKQVYCALQHYEQPSHKSNVSVLVTLYVDKQLSLSKIVNRLRDAPHAKAMQLWPPRAGGASLSKSCKLWATGLLEEEGQT